MRCSTPIACVFILILAGSTEKVFSQSKLYTARGYWEESTKQPYRDIKSKMEKGDSVSFQERTYAEEYEGYLESYFQKISQDEKANYQRLKFTWDAALLKAEMNEKLDDADYQFRPKNRLANGFYGLLYGMALVDVANITDAAAVGVPLITSGLWMLGPAINPKRYENINGSTIRALNSGRFLGLLYGAGLGLAVNGNSESSAKWTVGISALSSLVLGEIAFSEQKQKNYSAGYIEMVRHYGFLGPYIGVSAALGSNVNSTNLNGAAMLAGGVGGVLIGSHVARKYDYSPGDVDAVSSFTLISTGIGFTAIADKLAKDGGKSPLLYIPAATAIAGTILGQQMVKGVHLTDKQGSTLNLSVAGAALVGLGAVAMTKTNSAGVWVGVPTGLGLITHQVLFRNFKKKNLEFGLGKVETEKRRYSVALKIAPENYFLNQSITVKTAPSVSAMALQNPIFKLTIKLN